MSEKDFDLEGLDPENHDTVKMDSPFQQPEASLGQEWSPPEGDQASPAAQAPPKNEFSSAPRKLPPKLSSKVSRRFMGPVFAGLIIAGIFVGIGYWLQGDYRQAMELRFYGEQVEAVMGNAMSDEDGEWADVGFEYKGQWYEAQVDITKTEYNEVLAAPEGLVLTEVLFWPENPADVETVAWVQTKSPWSYIWAYYVGLVVLVFFFLIGLGMMRKRAKLYRKGDVAWATKTSDASYDSNSKQYSQWVAYQSGGMERRGMIRWKGAGTLVHDHMGRVLIIALPNKSKPVPLNDKEAVALRA